MTSSNSRIHAWLLCASISAGLLGCRGSAPRDVHGARVPATESAVAAASATSTSAEPRPESLEPDARVEILMELVEASKASAVLVVGYGEGKLAKRLKVRGIRTTIVEDDPRVMEQGRLHFALPSDARVGLPSGEVRDDLVTSPPLGQARFDVAIVSITAATLRNQRHRNYGAEQTLYAWTDDDSSSRTASPSTPTYFRDAGGGHFEHIAAESVVLRERLRVRGYWPTEPAFTVAKAHPVASTKEVSVVVFSDTSAASSGIRFDSPRADGRIVVNGPLPAGDVLLVRGTVRFAGFREGHDDEPRYEMDVRSAQPVLARASWPELHRRYEQDVASATEALRREDVPAAIKSLHAAGATVGAATGDAKEGFAAYRWAMELASHLTHAQSEGTAKAYYDDIYVSSLPPREVLETGPARMRVTPVDGALMAAANGCVASIVAKEFEAKTSGGPEWEALRAMLVEMIPRAFPGRHERYEALLHRGSQ